MASSTEDHPMAGQEREETCKDCFPEYQKISPEEYAARFSHQWGCFSFHEYTYQDPALNVWIQRLAEILFGDFEAIDNYRKEFLTDEEITAIEADEQDEDF